MTLEEAKKILTERLEPGLVPDGLDSHYDYLCYRHGDETACLDGDFGADQLEAIAIYMRATSAKPAESR